MNTRLKQLRLSLGLSQTAFGGAIGKSVGTVSAWEQKFRNIPSSAVLLICQTFNVSRHWLETGEGDMFEQRQDEISSDVVIKWIVSRCQELPDNLRSSVVDVARAIVETLDD